MGLIAPAGSPCKSPLVTGKCPSSLHFWLLALHQRKTAGRMYHLMPAASQQTCARARACVCVLVFFGGGGGGGEAVIWGHVKTSCLQSNAVTRRCWVLRAAETRAQGATELNKTAEGLQVHLGIYFPVTIAAKFESSSKQVVKPRSLPSLTPTPKKEKRKIDTRKIY